jgi:division/cell wall cluster transcriptional repressor MraZ
MATGGLLCLFAVVLACKVRDGSRAAAQSDPPPNTPLPAPSEPRPEPSKKDVPPSRAGGLPFDEVPPPATLLPGPEGKAAAPTPPLPAPKPDVKVEPAGFLSDLVPEPTKAKPSEKTPPSTIPMPSSPSAPPPPGLLKPVAVEGSVTPAGFVSPPDAKPDPGPPSPPAAPPVGPPPSFDPLGGAPASPPPPKPTDPLIAPKLLTPPQPPTPPPSNDKAPSTGWDKPSASPLPPPTPESVSPPPAQGEPPLAPTPGPVQEYKVRNGETMREIARRTMGGAERWTEIHKLNPMLKPDAVLAAGTTLRLPGDACINGDDPDPIKPLPAMHPKAGPAKPKVVLPLTGTYPANLDDHKGLTLPSAIREQLANAETVLVSPGPDQCLWLTNQAHLERLAQRLEHSPAREADVRVFKRLYFAQTEKAALSGDGKVSIPERLAQFAGLHQEVVLVGIDDHFELWDAARWKQYTQQKSAARSASGPDSE